jgi:hypothetical protein
MLIPLQGSPFHDGEGPQSMAVDPFGRYVYAAGEYDLALLTYRIAGNGTPFRVAGSSFVPGGGFQPWNSVVADPFGRFVYQSSGAGTNPANATLAVFQVGPNGLKPGLSYLAGYFSDSMAVDFFGQFLYAAVSEVKGTTGPVRGKGVAAYRIGGNGALRSLNGSPFLVEVSADSIAISP